MSDSSRNPPLLSSLMSLRFVVAFQVTFLTFFPNPALSNIVGPGAIGNYRPSGGRGGYRSRSYGTVSEFPAGFFIGGSSIPGVNGLYGKRGKIDHTLPHSMFYYYENEDVWDYTSNSSDTS